MRKGQGVGVDIVEYSRLEGISSLERFAWFILSPQEFEELTRRSDKIPFIASRFAAKEAVIKAHPLTLTAQDFEIQKRGKKPVVHFFNSSHRICTVEVSLAHSTQYAAAFAIANYQ